MLFLRKLQNLYVKLYLRLFSNVKNQMFSKNFQRFCQKYLDIKVGIGSYGYLYFPNGTKIGNYCSIADGVKFLAGNHPVSHISTAACFYNPAVGLVSKDYDIERKKIKIGNDVWIGQNSLITNKCTYIPNGVVIGAGSVVTKNPSPYSIVVGNPAHLLRKRFDDETIALLEKTRWWEFDETVLRNYVALMDNPKLFCAEIEKLREKEKKEL